MGNAVSPSSIDGGDLAKVKATRCRRIIDRSLTDEERDLVASCYSMACGIARYYARLHSWLFEPYYDQAINSLIKAAMQFDQERGRKFSTVASVYIHRNMGQVCEYQFRFCRHPLEKTICHMDFSDFPREAAIEVRLADGEPDFSGILALIPGLDGEVLAWRFRDGLNSRQIAERLGCSQPTAWRIERYALDRLRDLLT